MVRSELLGEHLHRTTNGIQVHIWTRGAKYIARGSYDGRRFGKTLGSDPVHAASELRHLLTEIEKGTFFRPSEKRQRIVRTSRVPEIDFRQLTDAFVSEKRKLRGKGTAAQYLSRLVPLLKFTEQAATLRRWPLVMDIDADRDFAIELRTFLYQLRVTRNGRPGAAAKIMSPRQVQNVLSAVRSALAWAQRPDVQLLPITFINPLTSDIVGNRPAKDPLRPIAIPIDRRIELVRVMDRYQLCHLALSMILPNRPEELCGLLISDVDFSEHILHFGTRFGGGDFNKARQSFHVSIPAEITPLLRACVADRVDGPLLRSRAVFEGRAQPEYSVANRDGIVSLFSEVAQSSSDVLSEQDAKRVFRRLLVQLGGASRDLLSKEFKRLTKGFGWSDSIRFYDLRGSVHTEMQRAGIPELELKYLTGRALRDILYEYVALDPTKAMRRYFKKSRRLIRAIAERAKILMATDAEHD